MNMSNTHKQKFIINILGKPNYAHYNTIKAAAKDPDIQWIEIYFSEKIDALEPTIISEIV